MSVRRWQPGWDDYQSLCGPSAAKQQKLDQQSESMRPAYSTAGQIKAVLTSHQTDNVAGGAPGLLGSAPPFPMFPWAANAGARHHRTAFNNVAQIRRLPSFGGDGLLPFPQPGFFSAPHLLQHGNGWLPTTGRTGLVCQSGGMSTPHSSESMPVSESETANRSFNQTGSEFEDPVVGVSPPEIPTQLEIDRIYSELDALNERMSLLRSGAALEIAYDDRGKQILELKKKRDRLLNKLKSERERQQVENLQLSKQLEQQYNISLGSNSSELPRVGRKQNKKSTKVPKNGQTEDEAALASLSLTFAKLTCQMSDLDCKIEAVMLSEDEALGMQDKQQTLHVLNNRKKALKRECATVQKSRKQLLKKATEGRFGLDPLQVLKILAKRIRTWKYLRPSHLNIAQDELPEVATQLSLENKTIKEDVVEVIAKLSKTQPASSSAELSNQDDVMIIDSVEGDDDVQIVSSDDSDLDTSSNNPQQQQRQLPTHHQRKSHRELRRLERKGERSQRTVSVIEGCVRRSGLAAEVDQSYFMLSALTSVLLARQRHGRLTRGTQPSSTPSTTEQPCALSRLTGEINSKLDLNTQVANERQQKNVRETVDLYLKIHSEQNP